MSKSNFAASAGRFITFVTQILILSYWTNTSLWSRFITQKARVRAGLENGTLHSLRHCFISHLVNDLREPITFAAELAGHAKVETTMKYIHVLPDHAKRAMDRFSLYGN